MKRISDDELKRIQLDILNYVDNFCEINDINYWIDYGTLLGAVYPFLIRYFAIISVPCIFIIAFYVVFVWMSCGPQFRKPCDIAFRILQTRWKLPASEMVYVGDNPAKDFQAPQQLGMKAVMIKNKNGLYLQKDGYIDYIISDLEELLWMIQT